LNAIEYWEVVEQKRPSPNRSSCLGCDASSYAARFPCEEVFAGWFDP